MTVHLTARLAWHDNGWNGRICDKPKCNTYCVGRHSYPGDVIGREQNIENEIDNAGKPLSRLPMSAIPPCVYSVNAFGEESITGYSNPPEFFYGGAKILRWEIPESTVCVWPYEAVYSQNVYDEAGRFDNRRREENVDNFFKPIQEQIDKGENTLVFYYVNYSNPFSEEDDPRYVLIGFAKIKEIGGKLKYPEANDYVKSRFADGIVWARNITSSYPEEGVRLPYHLYRKPEQAEILQSFVAFPDNPNDCKYGSKHLSNDSAISMLEKFLNSIQILKSIGDNTENWDKREKWVKDCITELWRKRGLYPGLLNVIRLLDSDQAIIPAKKMIEDGRSKEAHELFFSAVLENQEVPEFGLIGEPLKKLSRRWKLQGDDTKKAIIKDIIPRFDLDKEQIEHIISGDERVLSEHGLSSNMLSLIEKNPYVISENYVGKNPDDIIPWGVIDRGVIPSPELGGENLVGIENDAPERLRSLCVDTLRSQRHQTFESAESILKKVNERIEKLPEGKRPSQPFKEDHFDVDKEIIEKSIVMHREQNRLWLYLRSVYEDEREIEENLTNLIGRSSISLERPYSHENWKEQIRDAKSPLAEKSKKEYDDVVSNQAEACQKIFQKPLSVITGAAGTGKTSVICAIIRAIKHIEGEGAPVTILAPTGKAADRVREIMRNKEIQGVNSFTVHSFLAANGWLNKNLTFKREGGRRDASGTIIIDETSMIDLQLMATLIRAIDWHKIKRLMLVGDPNQLPPIGRGRVFYDIIEWLKGSGNKNSIAFLNENLRQMENRINDEGTAILELSELFTRNSNKDDDSSDDEYETPTSPEAEELIKQIHNAGDINKDLRVIYWNEPEEIGDLIINTIEKEMVKHTDSSLDNSAPYKLWREAFADNGQQNARPEKYQVLTPYRGDMYGVEAINQVIQKRIAGGMINKYGTVDGIALLDKVMQYRNRTKSDPIIAYNYDTGKTEKIEVFNGEIGFVRGNGLDKGKLGRGKNFHIQRFSVVFAGKKNFSVGYGKKAIVHDHREFSEKVEDNLELAYAISVHKSQGSEFDHTYFIIPKTGRLLSTELIYTALTRATRHCTLLVQGDVSTLLSGRRPENSQIRLTNSSLFHDKFYSVPDEMINRKGWYEEGKIHKALSKDMVRSKSELIIANALHDKEIEFYYEKMLKADDGSIYLPDFTIFWQGKQWYWEHWGMAGNASYDGHRKEKGNWYEKNFPGCLIETFEGTNFSDEVRKTIDKYFT